MPFLFSAKNKGQSTQTLDEIFAELDKERRDMLIESFGGFGQVFITTASKIPEGLSGSAESFLIKDGAIIGT